MAAKKVVKDAAKAVETKVDEVKAEVKKAEVKKEEVKKEEVKKAEPKKEEIKKEEVKKAEPKKEEAKKAEPKKAPAKKASAKKAEVKASVCIQFAGKQFSQEELVKMAKDVWQYDMGMKAEDFKSVEIYVKPEESTAYFVANGDVQGSFML